MWTSSNQNFFSTLNFFLSNRSLIINLLNILFIVLFFFLIKVVDLSLREVLMVDLQKLIKLFFYVIRVRPGISFLREGFQSYFVFDSWILIKSCRKWIFLSLRDILFRVSLLGFTNYSSHNIIMIGFNLH